MLTGLAWLALEVKYLEPAREFYGETLELSCREETERELRYEAGETTIVCRRPDGIPRGGLHTHFAFSIPHAEYDDWWDRLSRTYDLEEFRFGSSRSLYCYDPDGNCVELGQTDVEGPGIDGVFEVVLEVESLDRAEAFYEQLGFETVDRGEERTRVRMNGPMALELWEPQLGLADARGGVHVDLGFETADPAGVAEAVADRACSLESVGDEGGADVEGGADGDEGGADGDEGGADGDERIVVRDPDGHHLTFLTR